jgi:hypothetical protein
MRSLSLIPLTTLFVLLLLLGCAKTPRTLAVPLVSAVIPTAGWAPDTEKSLWSLQRPRELWHGEPLVHPRGIMLDPSNKWLWVSDPAAAETEPAAHPARIIRFPLVNNEVGKPVVFFQRPGFLHSAKWAVPVSVDGQRCLLVADQGEAKSEYEFSGKGAKVFLLPINSDESPGEPRVLWEGSPFVCPTGITLIGRYAIITDPCAGPRRERPERPGQDFPSSAIFALPIEGGKPPVTLQAGEPFTSLIGICPLVPGELIVNDTDSGRPDPRQSAGRRGFAPQASADRWVFKVIDGDPPRLSPPVRTLFTEEGTFTLRFSNKAKLDQPIELLARPGAALVDPKQGFLQRAQFNFAAPAGAAAAAPTIGATGPRDVSVRVASDVLAEKIQLDVLVAGRKTTLTLPKDPNRVIRAMDNKHGGARRRPSLMPAPGGGSGSVYDRFTLDNNAQHGGVYVYPDGGGTLRTIASGPPLVRPISGQLSPSGDLLWFVDQATGTLYSVNFPSPAQFDEWFGVQKPLRP